MKKVFAILLIALCCVSVFAEVTFGCWGKIDLSAGSDGYHYVINNNTWHTGVICDFTSDNVDLHIGFVPLNSFENFGIEYYVRVRPFDNFNFKVGSNSIFSFSNEIDYAKDMIYTSAEYYALDSGLYELKLAYQPNESKFFGFGEINQGIEKFGLLHADVLTKFDYDNNFSLDYAVGEISYSNNLSKELFDNLSDLTTKRVFVSDSFNYSLAEKEKDYFKVLRIDDNSELSLENFKFTNRLSIGLHYKYYTEFAKENENGLYGYGLICYAEDNNGFVAETEIGRNVANLLFGGSIRNSYDDFDTTGKLYSMAYFDWSDGSFNVKVDDVLGQFSCHPSDSEANITYIVNAEYLNKDSNTAQENGFFVTSGLSKGFSNGQISPTVKLGVDSLKNFQWKVSLTPTYWY